jgi:hypothetical protein
MKKMGRSLSLVILGLVLIYIISFVSAKNLYVSTIGSDSVSYANNDINHPWKTPERVWGYYDGNSVNYPTSELPKAGDIVYFRDGTYPITRTVGSKYTGNDGTAENPITFKNYNNENVIISGYGNGAPGNSLILIEYDYYNFYGLNFSGSGFGHEGAILYFYFDRHSVGSKVENCTFHITSSDIIDNVACVRLNSATNTIVRNNFFDGHGNNCNGVQMFRTKGAKIENNEFQNLGNGIFLKHSNSLEDTGVSFSNNYIYNCGVGVLTVSNYAKIENNLLVNCPITLGVDGGEGDGYVGADFNKIGHNTIYNNQLDLIYESNSDDPNKGCLNNNIQDNIFMKKNEWHAYDYMYPSNEYIKYFSDYNLYIGGNILSERSITYTLATWRTHNGNDSHSISGTPIFIGGTSPTTILGFALASNSPGYRNASDGKDIGADVSLVGPNPGSINSPTEYCNDGACNNGETCSTCLADCGACPATLNVTTMQQILNNFGSFKSGTTGLTDYIPALRNWVLGN